MPWTIKDADSHKKNLSSSEKKKWVAIANAILDRTSDEVLAIKIANSRTKKINETTDPLLKVLREEISNSDKMKLKKRMVDLQKRILQIMPKLKENGINVNTLKNDAVKIGKSHYKTYADGDVKGAKKAITADAKTVAARYSKNSPKKSGLLEDQLVTVISLFSLVLVIGQIIILGG